MRISSKVNISSECAGAMLKYLTDLRNMKMWAVKMIDATGKPVPGVLGGILGFNGDFDTCLDIENEIKGHYCPVFIRPPLPKPTQFHRLTQQTPILNISSLGMSDSILEHMEKELFSFYRFPLRFGFCIPASCSPYDLKNIIKAVVEKYQIEINVPYCSGKLQKFFFKEDFVILLVFGVLLLVSIVSTYFYKRNSSIERFEGLLIIIECFSISKNFQKWISLDQRNNSNIHFLNGFKFISMLWIIMAHTYGFIPLYGSGGIQNIYDMMKHYSFLIFANAWPSVDNFFLCSGVLVGYSTLFSLKAKNGLLNPTRLMLKRFCRLGPPMWIMVGLIFTTKWFASGPMWKEGFEQEINRCRKTWWATFLFLNSWLGYDQMCLVQTWYSSAELHLFLFGILFVYLLYRNFRFGVFFGMAIILLSVVTVGWTTIIYDLHPSILFQAQDEEFMKNGMRFTYFRFYCHISPYFTGVCLGYLFQSQEKIIIPKFLSIINWIVAFLFLSMVLFVPYEWHNGNLPSKLTAALYQSFHKPAWGLSIGWIILYCYYNEESTLRKIFQVKIFIPLSKLTYMMYLINMLCISYRNSTRRLNIYVSHLDIFYEFCGNLIITLILSIILYIFVESPTQFLISFIFGELKNKCCKLS